MEMASLCLLVIFWRPLVGRRQVDRKSWVVVILIINIIDKQLLSVKVNISITVVIANLNVYIKAVIIAFIILVGL